MWLRLKVITISTLKDSIGKSNFVFDIGGLLSENKKVLLIYIDP